MKNFTKTEAFEYILKNQHDNIKSCGCCGKGTEFKIKNNELIEIKWKEYAGVYSESEKIIGYIEED